MLTQLAAASVIRQGGFMASDSQLDALLEDAGTFLEAHAVRIRLLSPALNVHGARDVFPIHFPGGIILRPMTDEECTDIYGGNPIFSARGTMPFFPDFIFVKDVELPLVVGEPGAMRPSEVIGKTHEHLSKCALALATFKDGGATGYDGIYMRSLGLTLGVGFNGGHVGTNEHVPLSHYEITADEADALQKHAMKFGHLHGTLEMAAQRLVDSSRRAKPRDSIVDAIIGLESILLVQIGAKERTETRFRFALNYASIQNEHKKSAFHTARDLYDLRSTIAHGSTPKSHEKINGQELTLHEAAIKARTMLRTMWNYFARAPERPEFLAADYWLDVALGNLKAGTGITS
jgi:hypothetical protein